jgi:tetratricopeptide (TPR) repeat protein
MLRYESFAGKFVRRPFTMEERLLTQGRIVWDYVGQWVWPETTRMGIYHDDIVVSTSLTEPLATLYALLAWALLLLVSALLLRWRWGCCLVFGLAWFLVGHAVESTVLPLEMYFEHRNYFPAIGLALSLGVLAGGLMTRIRETRVPLLVWLSLLPLMLSAHTSSQVQIWSSRPLLILNHLNGHPGSSRANIDMAQQLATLGDLEAAHHYSARAFEVSSVERAGDWEIRDLALNCIANVSVQRQEIDDLGKVDPQRPFSSVTTLLAIVRLIQNDQCAAIDKVYFADRLAEIFLQEDYRGRASANIYSNLAVLENALQRWENAYAYSERFLALSPGNKRGLLMKLHFATALGKVKEANAVIATLQTLQDRGELTVGEQQTLALYLEN